MNVNDTLKKMSLEDKIALCSGLDFWRTKGFEQYDIPSVFMCDGPHGLRKQKDIADMLGVNESVPATCFPTAVTSGAAWDPELLEEMGAAIGEEAVDQEVVLVLGPGANLKRNPLCGRNFEYFSEDPYLSGKLASGVIRGIQKNGTAASLKHFACNNQEKSRFSSDGVLDERTLRELYLTGFEMAVKETQPGTVMCSYPKVNGIHASDHHKLLTEILRDEWGFQGLVVTDWGAMNDRIEGFRAGCDLNMPGGSAYMEDEVLEAVKTGKLSEAEVDACAARVLQLVANSFKQQKSQADYGKHHELAKRVAVSGAVLLKNEDRILPLQENVSVALIGHMAKEPRYQGAGSSHINPVKLTSAVEAMPQAVYVAGCRENGETDESLLREAVSAAKQADVAVVFAGLPGTYESEGFDRENLRMPEGHVRMIEAVANANPNTVVVLSCGCVVECPWADQVKAVLYLGLSGQAGGEAAVDLLTGKANPGGKLTESWPFAYEDCPSSQCFGTKDALYMEGLYVGYRYYEKAEVPVRWPFGYGLSYTSFAYSDLQITDRTVRVTIANTGDRAGSEVVQLYVKAPQDGPYRPVKELKGFRKIFLQPGESRRVEFTLDDRSFAIWQEGWVVPAGEYTIEVAASSQDVRLSKTMIVQGEVVPVPVWQQDSWYASPKGKPNRADWETMLGHPYEEYVPVKGQYTMENSVEEMKEHSLVMKILYKAVEHAMAKKFGGKKAYDNPEFRMTIASSLGAPIRSMQIAAAMDGNLFRGLVTMANGHPLRGIRLMLKK